jgi:hypothetical protein
MPLVPFIGTTTDPYRAAKVVLAYCGRCKRWHWFGYDLIGAPVELLACWQCEPPAEAK